MTGRLLLLIFAFASPSSFGAGSEFQSASSVEEVREQISRLPKDDIWWSVTGEDMGWNARNLNRIHPTVIVHRDGQVRELEYALMPGLAQFPVDTPQGPMPFRAFLDSEMTRVFGVVILHQGRIVFEHYPRMQAYERPTYWSVSKVMVAAMVSILEDRGRVDTGQPIETYIPEMAGSAHAGILVRNILDMATGVDCLEEYYDRESCFYGVMQSFGEAWWDEDSPDNLYQQLVNLKAPRTAEQGTRQAYQSVNTDILGWMVEKITGMPFQDALSRDIWTRIGAENDAAYLAPRFGVPHFDGGFLAKMRDMARFGLLYTPSYSVVTDERIISERHVNALLHDGNPDLLWNARSDEWKTWAEGKVRHNTYQWDTVFTNDDIYKGGWAGQGLLINPKRDLVAVYTGYFKDDEGSEEAVLPRLRSVLEGVFGNNTGDSE